MDLTKIRKTSVAYHRCHRITYFNDSQCHEDTCTVSGFLVTGIITEPNFIDQTCFRKDNIKQTVEEFEKYSH